MGWEKMCARRPSLAMGLNVENGGQCPVGSIEEKTMNETGGIGGVKAYYFAIAPYLQKRFS